MERFFFAACAVVAFLTVTVIVATKREPARIASDAGSIRR